MRYKKNQIYAVTFLDHVEDGIEPIEFVVYGKLIETNKKYIVIGGWVYKKRKGDPDSNEKVWTILKSTITGSVCLEQGKEGIGQKISGEE